MKVRWTAAARAELLRLAGDGLAWREIGARFGLTEGGVHAAFRQYGSVDDIIARAAAARAYQRRQRTVRAAAAPRRGRGEVRRDIFAGLGECFA